MVAIATLAILALAITNYLATTRSESVQVKPSNSETATVSAKASPQEQPLPDQNYLDNPRAAMKRVERLARESGGDWNKLSANDQRMLNSMTLGRGRQMLETTAAKYQKNRAAK